MSWKCPKCGREFSKKDQHHFCEKPKTIDACIEIQEEAVQEKLKEVRQIIRAAIPEAEERIAWSMPTYWKEKNIIHFAASKRHIGLYPGEEAVRVFAEDLKDYDTDKGTIRIPYDKETPKELITKIAQYCYEHRNG